MSIRKTEINADIEQMSKDLETVLLHRPWPEVVDVGNQIGLRHRPNPQDPWLDSHGSLYDKEQQIFVAKEQDFSVWNSLVPGYTKSIIEELANKEKSHNKSNFSFFILRNTIITKKIPNNKNI